MCVDYVAILIIMGPYYGGSADQWTKIYGFQIMNKGPS